MEFDKNKFIEQYLNPEISLKFLQKEFNIKHDSDIYRIRKKLNLPLIDRKNKGKSLTEEILKQLYIIENKKIEEIAILYNLNKMTVYNKLELYNIQKKKVIRAKHYVDHNYFKNINEENARVLGLIASDGNIIYAARSYNIRFASKDIELCNFIKDKIGGSIYFSEKRNIHYNQIISEEIFNFLNNIGITPNKSKTLEIDFSIFNTKELMYSFLIGIIDGDGYVAYNENNSKFISIVSGSEKFKNQIIKYFPEFSSIRCDANYLKNEDLSYTYTMRCAVLKNLSILINNI